MIMHLFLRLGRILAKYVPLRLGYAAALVFASVAYRRGGERRQVLFENLAHVVGTSVGRHKVDKIAQRSYQNLAKYYYEVLRLPYMHRREIMRQVHFQGLENLDEAVRLRKGVILVLAHQGNWDLCGAALSARYKTTIYTVAENLRPRGLYNFFVSTRASIGIETVDEARRGREIVRILREGGIVALLSDRDLRGDGVPVSFFGAKATMPRGPVTLAMRTEAQIVPSCIMRRRDNTFISYFEQPITVEVTAHRRCDMAATVQRIANCMERFIRRHPSQWFVMQPVWPRDKDLPHMSDLKHPGNQE